MESNPLLQTNVSHPTAIDHGVHTPEAIARVSSFVQAVEKVMNTRKRTSKVRMPHARHLSSVPDQLIHDIVSFSPEALKCSHGEECPY